MNMIEIVSPSYKAFAATHTAATTAKVPVAINSIVLLPLNDADANAENGYVYEAQLRGPLKSGDSPALGATLYWDATNEEFTVTATANTKVGRWLMTDSNGDCVVDYDAFNAPA